MEIIKTIKIIIGVVFVMTLIVIAFYFKPNTLTYEYVYEIPVEYDETENASRPWLTFVNEEYNPMISIENLSNDYVVDIENIDYDFDYENYSYIACYGHKLQKLSFRYCNALQRKTLLIPYEISGDATLSLKQEDGIFIYRFKKINLSFDYHGRDCTFYK